MTRDLDALYRDVPEPKHIWVTQRETHAARSIPEADPAWDAFLARHPLGHVLQSSRWAALKAGFGWAPQRAVLRTIPSPDAPILGGASILFRRLPWGQTLAYVPKGPVVDWSDAAQTRAVLTMVREFSLKARAALIKIEPELPASDEFAALLAGYGFRPSPQRVQPLSTIHVAIGGADMGGDSIAGAEDAILSAMKSKWRYNIRLAERKGVTVREGGAADLPAIQRLLDVTGARDGFGVHSAAYYARATELFMPDGLPRAVPDASPDGSPDGSPDTSSGTAAWLIAEHEDHMLAAIAVFALGHMAWYMWGASSDEGRNLMPNHALQWAAIRWARARGCTVYDLWGIPDEVGENPAAYTEPESWGEGGLWGVYRFKQGFGGRVVRYTGPWDLPLSRPGYALYRLALRVVAARSRGAAGEGG